MERAMGVVEDPDPLKIGLIVLAQIIMGVKYIKSR